MASRIAKIDKDAELTKLKSYYTTFVDELDSALDEAQSARKYYDGQQWTSDEEAELTKRGQPVVTINLIAKKVNFVLGAEVDERTDPAALPRTPTHEDECTAITDALRYVTESEKFNLVKSLVAEDQLITGFGAAVVEVEKVRDEVKIRYRRVPWDRFWYDPHSRDPLFTDAKYKGAVVWMDEDDAKGRFRGKDEIIEAAIDDASTYTDLHDDKPSDIWADDVRRRIKVCETYYQRSGTWHQATFTGSGFLVDPQVVQYVDEYGTPVCPLIAVSSYVRDDDGARYGLVANMISPQDEVNKRRSKALHALSTRQVILEQGAVNDIETTRTEVARPDGVVVINPGFAAAGGFRIETNTELAQGQAQLLQEAKSELMTIGADAQVGDVGTGTSGRAILARQQIANRELKRPFDNLRQWTLTVYEHTWYRIKQFWTSETWLRVRDTDDLKGYRFVGLNRTTTKGARLKELIDGGVDPMQAIQAAQIAPEVVQQVMQQVQQQALTMQGQGQQIPEPQLMQMALQLAMQHPAMGEPFIAADVAHLDVDIVLETVPDTAVLEQEEFETLSQLTPAIVQARPDLAPKMTELIIKASQLRAKKEILEALKPAQPDPAEQEKQQQAEQMQQQQIVLTMQQLAANVGKTQAQTEQAKATAAKTAAEIETLPSKAKANEAQAMKQTVEAGLALGEAQTPEPDLAIVVGKPSRLE